MFPNESSSADILRFANAFPQNFQDASTDNVPVRRLVDDRLPAANNVVTSATAQPIPIDQVPASRGATNERIASVVGTVAGDGDCRLSQAQMLSTTHRDSKDGAEISRQAAVGNSLPGAYDGDVKQFTMGTCEHSHHPHPSSKSEALCQEGRRANWVGARADLDSFSQLSFEAVFSASVISSSSCGTVQSPSHHRARQPHTSSSSNSDSSCAQSLDSIEDTNTTGGADNANSLTITQDANDSSELRIASVFNIPGIMPTLTVQGTMPISFNDITNVKDKHATSEGPATNIGWGIPKGLGLRGGGESSLNAGTSSWGAPPGGSTSAGTPAGTGWGGSNQGQGGSGGQGQWSNAGSRSSTAGQGSANQQAAGGGGGKVGGNQSSGQPGQGPAQQGQQNGASTSWAQAAGKGLPAGPQGPVPSTSSAAATTTTTTCSTSGATTTTSSTANTTTKQQLEQLNTMREALFSQDGWGGQHVNQDTGWDIPPSPEPGAKDGVPAWKPNVNNGTDLWEANLRNGGQPPPTQTQKTPWGHTPTTNIGGTWGEDDDIAESSNVWTGVPSNVGPATAASQWGANPAPTAAGMWGVAKKDSDWVGGAASVASNWGDPRSDPRGDPRNIGPLDPRDMRAGNDPRELRGAGMLDPRDHMRGVVDSMRGDPRDMRSMGDMRGTDPMIRGDPRGISGRLNTAVADSAMWGQPPQPPHHHGPHHQSSQPPGKLVGPGATVNQWTGPPPKDLGMSGAGPKQSGWEEPSPPAQRRNIPNYDDGTSLWGNPSQQQARLGGKVSHWKEMPSSNMGRGGLQCPPGMPQNRIPGNAPGNMKADGPLWGHPARNGSWGDGPHETVSTGWADDPKTGVNVGVSSWNENPLTPTPWVGGPKPNTSMNPGWVDDDSLQPWGPPPKQGHNKPLSKDLLWASKQFRILVDRGHKKEDVESALRISNMNFDDAQELLTAGRLNVEWRRHEDHSPFDLTSNHPGSGFPGQRFNPVAQQIPFAPPGGPGVGSTPNLMNNLSAGNPNLASINNISPAIVQKILTQQPPPQQPPTHQQAAFTQGSRGPQNQPSTAQLRMLVQQIQMAVQAGYLNHQILNQPLAPQTLILLNQLLQQIKVLQQLLQQQAVIHAQPMKNNSNAVLQISVQITKTKQQINNLQNQIASQQAIYVKQQQQHHHMAAQGPHPNDYKTSYHDPLATLHSNLGDLSIKDPQVSFQNQQSRLIQWKLPSVDKDGDGMNEFSRAPGSTTKPSLPQSHSSPNINPLLGQADGTWSTVTRSASDTGWPDSSGTESSGQPDSKEPWPVTSQSSSAAFTDLVPEFEPGKPWKGTQMKSIEEDPSITPGSVHRSPLSLATIKDSEIFTGGGGAGGTGGGGVSKTSPTVSTAVDTAVPPLSLSSSTWSFNPPSSTASSSFTSPLGKLGAAKGPWGEAPPPTAVTSELWGAPMSKSRGPPPGLSSKVTAGLAGGGGGSNSSSNGWGVVGGGHSSWGTSGGNWGSTWLLLKNLTPQVMSGDGGVGGTEGHQSMTMIDGSTLKTLCMQHGPLQSFHLYLNHGIALAKYSTREEANKAQGALNNCVLGNTTIFAESPGVSEVQALLQHLGQQPASTGGWGGLRAGAAPPNTKSSGSADAWAPWTAPGQSGTLWGGGQLEADQHRATPSSLNSFLPGDLLGETSGDRRMQGRGGSLLRSRYLRLCSRMLEATEV